MNNANTWSDYLSYLNPWAYGTQAQASESPLINSCNFSPTGKLPIRTIGQLPESFKDMRTPSVTEGQVEYLRSHKLAEIQNANTDLLWKVVGYLGWDQLKLWNQIRPMQAELDKAYQQAETYLPDLQKEQLAQYQNKMLNGHNYYMDKLVGLASDGLFVLGVPPYMLFRQCTGMLRPFIPSFITDSLKHYLANPLLSFSERTGNMAACRQVEAQGPVAIKTYQARYQQTTAGWLSDFKKIFFSVQNPDQHAGEMADDSLKSEATAKIKLGEKLKDFSNDPQERQQGEHIYHSGHEVLRWINELDLKNLNDTDKVKEKLNRLIERLVNSGNRIHKLVRISSISSCQLRLLQLHPATQTLAKLSKYADLLPSLWMIAQRIYSHKSKDRSQPHEIGTHLLKIAKWPLSLLSITRYMATILPLLIVRKAEAYKSLLDQVSALPDELFLKQQSDLKEAAKSKDYMIEENGFNRVGSGSINQAYIVKLSDDQTAFAKFVRPDAQPERMAGYCQYLYYTNLIRFSQGSSGQSISDEDKIRAYNQMLFQINAMKEESHLSHEVKNMARLKEAFRAAGIESLKIPEILAHTDSGVLLEKMPGENLHRCMPYERKEALQKAGPDILRMSLVSNECHGDIHEGNLLYCKKTGQVSLIDTGIQFHYDARIRQALLTIMRVTACGKKIDPATLSQSRNALDLLAEGTAYESKMTDDIKKQLIEDIFLNNHLSHRKDDQPWTHEIFFNYIARNQNVPYEQRLKPLSIGTQQTSLVTEGEQASLHAVNQAHIKTRACLEPYLSVPANRDKIVTFITSMLFSEHKDPGISAENQSFIFLPGYSEESKAAFQASLTEQLRTISNRHFI